MKAQGQKPEATDDEGYGFLHRAVLLGDPALIRRLVTDGADINAKDRSGMTALYRAMEKRDYAVMDALFAVGADPEERYNMGSFRNPLCYAAAQGDLELMRKLMAKGARAYSKGAPDPLIAAIIWQKPEAARLLLDSGAPAGGQRDEGYTPLAASITWRGSSLQKDVAELLLARGADIDEVLGSGDTALDYALRMNSQAGADFLRGKGAHKKDELPKGAAAKQEPAKGENAGKKGAEAPQQAAAPAQPLAKEGAGKTGAAPQQPAVVQAHDSFFDAVARGDSVAVSAFLSAGTKLDMLDKEGRTALVLAAQQNNVSLCSLLLARGANPDLVDSQKQSPLHAACAAGAPDAIVALLLGGAAVDLRDNAGRTPLYLAAQNGLLDAIRLLAERGANLNTSDTAGRFAVGIAKMAGRNDAVALLLSLGATDAPAPASPPRKK
jgi:ankyrin repeat protein